MILAVNPLMDRGFQVPMIVGDPDCNGHRRLLMVVGKDECEFVVNHTEGENALTRKDVRNA